MADQDFLLIVYDISNDRRRTRLHNVLLDFGTPVQYSVFECLLGPAETAKMKQALRRVIKPKKDRVRFYPICKNCLAKVEITSGIEVLQEGDAAIVVREDGEHPPEGTV